MLVRFGSRPLAAVVFALLSTLATAAWAQEAARRLPPPRGHTRGITWEATLAANGLTDSAFIEELPYFDAEANPLMGSSLALLYRPIDYVSVGLLAHLGFLAADVVDVADDAAGIFGALVEVRGHFPLHRFDPWVGFGLGYVLAYGLGRGGEGSLEDVDFDFRWTLHGMGLAVSTGVNIFVTPNLAISPFFRMLFGIYPGGCYSVFVESLIDNERCDELEDIYGEGLDDLPHLWITGIGLHFAPPRDADDDDARRARRPRRDRGR